MPSSVSHSTTSSTTGAEEGNNFNALRLAFALLVVVYHMAVLPGLPGWKSAEEILSVGAEIGVQGFFVLSGYLVYQSLERSRSIALYAEKRARRLFPAYATVVTGCVIAALIFSSEARDDLDGVFHYLVGNISFLNFLQPNLPGVFEENRFAEVNGALWTLKIEVFFYILLPPLVWLMHQLGRRRWVLIALIYTAAEVWRIGFGYLQQPNSPPIWMELARQLPGQMSFFITGVAFAIARPSPTVLRKIGFIGAIFLLLSLAFPFAEPVRAFGLGALSLMAAKAAPRLPDAARYGDLSYGLYILHFPIIQTLVALGLFNTPALGVCLSIIIALAGSLLLWRYVERPALRSDSAYRKAH